MPNVSTGSNVPQVTSIQEECAGNEEEGNEDIEVAEEITESDSSPIVSVPLSTDDNESPIEEVRRNSDVEIEEVFECESSSTNAPEPIITEQEEVSETTSGRQSDMITEIPTVCMLTTNTYAKLTLTYVRLKKYLSFRSGRTKCNYRI